MLPRNIKLSTIPPSPSQQHSLTCSNITTSAPAQFAGHQVFSKDRICNWTLQRARISSWKGAAGIFPFHQSSERKGSADRGGSPAGVQGMQHTCHDPAHWGGEPQACSPSAGCPTSGSAQGPVCPAVHLKEVVRHSCWD